MLVFIVGLNSLSKVSTSNVVFISRFSTTQSETDREKDRDGDKNRCVLDLLQ